MASRSAEVTQFDSSEMTSPRASSCNASVKLSTDIHFNQGERERNRNSVLMGKGAESSGSRRMNVVRLGSGKGDSNVGVNAAQLNIPKGRSVSTGEVFGEVRRVLVTTNL